MQNAIFNNTNDNCKTIRQSPRYHVTLSDYFFNTNFHELDINFLMRWT